MNFDNIAGDPLQMRVGVSQLTRRLFLAGGCASTLVHAGTLKAGTIAFEVIRHGSSRRHYLHIHGNESTAREVLRRHMREYSGTAHLIRSTDRTVNILGGKLDPNRMFSREGAEANLKLLNRDWDDARVQTALALLDRNRDKLVKALAPPPGGALFAIHNNSRGYSVETEVPISDEVALNDRANPHEFFLAVQPSDFRLIAQSPYNVVLQNRTPPSDDGSFSRLAAKRGWRYVNLEVTLGKVEKQREMLNWLERTLP